MKTVRSISQALSSYPNRYEQLKERFKGFSKQVETCFAEPNSTNLRGVRVAQLGMNRVSIEFAGFTVMLVFTTRVENDVLVGVVECFKCKLFPELKYHLVSAFSFAADGDTGFKGPNGDIVDLESYAQYLVLNLLDQAVQMTIA